MITDTFENLTEEIIKVQRNENAIKVDACILTFSHIILKYVLDNFECTNCRNKGVGRTLINHFVEYCNAHQIENCYLWPDGKTAERIYQEAGFRTVAIKQAGRATYRAH